VVNRFLVDMGCAKMTLRASHFFGRKREDFALHFSRQLGILAPQPSYH
jgi:hypothetical protein